MSWENMFNCPKCNQPGVVYVVKQAGAYNIVKVKCPNHGAKSLKLPIAQKEQYISNIKEGVFRCYKCGATTKLGTVKISGPWALVRMICPTHQSKLPYQKIWNTIYAEISAGPLTGIATAGVTQTSKGKVIFDVPPTCPYCKAPLSRENAKWAGPASVICPYCSTTVPATERQL